MDAYKEYLTFLHSDASDQVAREDTVTDTEYVLPDTSNEDLYVSFTKYTHPSDLEYFNEHYAVRNWTQAYVRIVKCLFAGYPDKIRSLIGLNIGGRDRVDFADSAGVDTMIDPKEIAEDLYLETNESADGIVKKIGQLLDICDVNYENVVITYSTSRTSKAQDVTSAPSKNIEKKPSEENDSFCSWLVEAQGMAEATGRNYTSAINTADEYVKEQHIGYGNICETTDYTAVYETADALFQTEFAEFNQRQKISSIS